MGEFFRGWKRKVGCFTLLLALMFMGGWVRSFVVDSDPFVADLIDFREVFGFPVEDNAIAGLGSYNQSLALMAYGVVEFESSPTPNGSVILSPDASQSKGEMEADLDRIPSVDAVPELPGGKRLLVDDLVLRQTRVVPRTTSRMLLPVAFVSAPFWSIVLPLTLLSAYLLLSKPRQSNQGTISEPTVVAGA